MAKKTKTQPKARKTITSNNLADLSKLVQALEIDDENPENQQKPSALDKKIIYNEFQNSTYTLVSPMAYLIGIDKENFGEENARPFLLKSYEELDAHKEARIIRNLCRIRTAMERNYPAIVNEFRMSFRNIGACRISFHQKRWRSWNRTASEFTKQSRILTNTLSASIVKSATESIKWRAFSRNG